MDSLRLFRKYLHNNQEGFTLVELIVVVVIIGVLSAISIPSFRNMRYKADEAEAQVIANSIIKATAIIYTRDGVMPTKNLGCEITHDLSEKKNL